MTTVKSPLDDDARKTTGDALQIVLVDLIDLSLLAKQVHWNVTGRNFRSVHLQLDEVVELSRAHQDVLAERAIAIGYNPDGRSSTVADATELEQVEDGYVEDGVAIESMVDILAAVVEHLRSAIEATAEADPVSQDLLITAAEDVEKQYWMWQAML
jgi:starvation-inducible DNA-binding protein